MEKGRRKRDRKGKEDESKRGKGGKVADQEQYNNCYSKVAVLVVDDNSMNRKMMVALLRRIGVDKDNIRTAANGYEALEVLGAHAVVKEISEKEYLDDVSGGIGEAVMKEKEDSGTDLFTTEYSTSTKAWPLCLALVDVHMPLMGGIELVRHVRKIEEKSRSSAGADLHLVMVAVTASDHGETIQECLAVGMDSVLHKPFQLEDLEGVLQKYLCAEQMRPPSS